MTLQRRSQVAIVGAGFAGLWALRELARAPVDVTLIDQNNFHTFLPLLYQVAAAEIAPEAIAYPVRSLLRRQGNAAFCLDTVVGLDLPQRQIITAHRRYSYDYLVLALGAETEFFDVPGAAEHGFALRTLAQAVALRNQILRCFELAEQATDSDMQRQLLTFVIVGGGPTGVEFAGALAELVHGPLRRDHPRLPAGAVQIELVEATTALLPGLPDRLRAYALKRLQAMGVHVRLQTVVRSLSAEGVHLQDGASIPSQTVIWTAGVRGARPAAGFGLPVARNGRVAVLPTLQLAEHPEVYVVGDLALLAAEGRGLPMVAPVAVQAGATAAHNVLRALAGQPPQPFAYHDRGTMVTIGRNAGVAHVFGRAFTGFSAWVLWLGVHLYNLIGFYNRLLVLAGWAWDYFFFERTVRLILPTEQDR